MDALKWAGRAIRRHSVSKETRTVGRHRKLPENWTDTRGAILEGMTFNLRHIGMTLVAQPQGEGIAAEAIKRIIAMAKASGKKAEKVSLKVSIQGITLYDTATNRCMENISIFKISFCTVDKVHDRVFAFIAESNLNGTLACHAYLCSKRKEAKAVALTVAQAFRVTLELWEVARDEGRQAKPSSGGEVSSNSNMDAVKDVSPENLLDSEGTVRKVDELDNQNTSESINNQAWEIHNDLDATFSRSASVPGEVKLAMSRSKSQILDAGVIPQEWLNGPDWDSVNGNTPPKKRLSESTLDLNTVTHPAYLTACII
uniref:low density lipoprotein receptor adapter protein 1a isoform X2 n=1 Tax=Doryrhamphus excisus TaxID=161450 RepID=UPI0025ADD61A|nr:low density lipoprotein receptor adapter protein 1a isoform X2 [Doryrhamphus excisus]